MGGYDPFGRQDVGNQGLPNNRPWANSPRTAGSGTLVGEVRITDCFPVTLATLARRERKRRITSVLGVVAKYRRIYAWVLADAVRYSSPIAYRHPPGAVSWVRTGDMGCAFRGVKR